MQKEVTVVRVYLTEAQHELEKRLTEMTDRYLLDDADTFEMPDAWELADFEDLLPHRA